MWQEGKTLRNRYINNNDEKYFKKKGRERHLPDSGL